MVSFLVLVLSSVFCCVLFCFIPKETASLLPWMGEFVKWHTLKNSSNNSNLWMKTWVFFSHVYKYYKKNNAGQFIKIWLSCRRDSNTTQSMILLICTCILICIYVCIYDESGNECVCEICHYHRVKELN